jgi:hypothetical protein
MIKKDSVCDIDYKIDQEKINQFKNDFNALIGAFKNIGNKGVVDINKPKMVCFLDKLLLDLKQVNSKLEQKEA